MSAGGSEHDGSGSGSSDSLYDEALDARRSPPSEFADDYDDAERGINERFGSVRRQPLSAIHPARYAFAQAFGERAATPVDDDGACVLDVQEADMISSVRFNHDASMVATGDRGGRVVLLRRDYQARRRPRARKDEEPTSPPEPPEYRFWTQFQSHEPEFDYLKSTEIEERINEIRWCRPAGDAQRLLVTNDKTIKLWRVSERDVKQLVTMTRIPRNQSHSNYLQHPTYLTQSTFNHLKDAESPTALRDASFDELRAQFARKDTRRLILPKMNRVGTVVGATPRRIYANSHAYHINSIALSSDEETFLSADDLRINVWHLARAGEKAPGFNVVDIKPDNMEDLAEVITCAEFHPKQCHLFCHSSSKGSVKLCDLRSAALCDTSVKVFEDPPDPAARSSFFSEIIASIADVKFSPCGRYILTRDYMTLRLWDLNMENTPVLTVPVHEALRPHLSEMYENDAIFDKFRCAFSHDGHSILTGGYRSQFLSYSAYTGVGNAVEATVDFVAGINSRGSTLHDPAAQPPLQIEDFTDPHRKIQHLDAAINEPVAAVAAGPALYMYYVPTL